MRSSYVRTVVKECIERAAREYGIILHLLAVEIDHVHAFATISFNLSPSDTEGKLKGRSAYLIFRILPNFRLRYLKGHFGSPGKFMRTVSNVTSATVKNYIENQEFPKLHETIPFIVIGCTDTISTMVLPIIDCNDLNLSAMNRLLDLFHTYNILRMKCF